MKEIVSGLNTHTLTAYTVGAETESVAVRATEEAVEEAVNNNHLDIILKDIFAGTFSAMTRQLGEFANYPQGTPELSLEDIKPFMLKPFGLFIPLNSGPVVPFEVVEFLPEGWEYSDPCITTYIPFNQISERDFIINLRTKEVVYIKESSDSVTEIPSKCCPTVSGEAQAVFSMFITNLDSYGLMTVCKAPVSCDLSWYKALGEGQNENLTSFFSGGSSAKEMSEKILESYDETASYSDRSPSNLMSIPDNVSTYLTDEYNICVYTQHRLKGESESLEYCIRNTEADISYMDKIHRRFSYLRDDDGPLPTAEESPFLALTYKRHNCFVPTDGKIDPMALLNSSELANS